MATKTYKPKRKISATESEEIKIPASSVDGLSTVATSGSYNDLSNKPTIPDVSGLMPKSGGAFTGNISVPSTITFTDTTNPYIKMTTGGTAFYFQSTSSQFGLGPTWDKATHWDSNGNVTFPTTPKVGSSSLALVSDLGGKANLNGGNSWTGDQQFNNARYYFATDATHYFTVETEPGDALVSINQNGFDLDSDALGNMPFLIAGSAGTSGQVLASQGAGKTPQWTNPAIKSATLSGTTLTITL